MHQVEIPKLKRLMINHSVKNVVSEQILDECTIKIKTRSKKVVHYIHTNH